MKLATNLMRSYFDLVYNPVYDLVTSHVPSYRRLQSACVNKLRLNDGDNVMCAGVGTGNEIIEVLGRGKNVNIVGVDCSGSALRRASRKAMACGQDIEVIPMDIERLEFTTGSFDEVICLHVMDWVYDEDKATAEIIRVLKNGGQFVITYPSNKENISMALNVLRDSIRHNGNIGEAGTIYSVLLSILLGGIVYLPLLLRPKRRYHSRRELEVILSEVADGSLQIEEYPVYNDYIVYGRK